MTDRAARNAGADRGVSLTGVTGTDPQDGYAPGTVFSGADGHWALSDEISTHQRHLSGDRWEIRLTSAKRALQEMLTMVCADRAMKEA